MVLAPLSIDDSVKTWWKTATEHQKDKYVAAHVISSIDEKASYSSTILRISMREKLTLKVKKIPDGVRDQSVSNPRQ